LVVPRAQPRELTNDFPSEQNKPKNRTSKNVDYTVDPDFLDRFEELIDAGVSRPVVSTPFEPHPVSIMKDPVTWLYPPIEPYSTGRLQVSPVHELYFEQSGNPSGKPVVFLHGGPGGGSDAKQRSLLPPGKIPHR
jgi:pimeloyl-ACP methyl ester carboxylesterase